MTSTVSAGVNPRQELKRRLRFLTDVELPLLGANWGEAGSGMAALRFNSERELRDITELLDLFSRPVLEQSPSEPVSLNDCVTVLDYDRPVAEEMIVHDARLIVQAPGCVSAGSELGSAILGRRTGDLIRVGAGSGVRTYQLVRVRRPCAQSHPDSDTGSASRMQAC